jgi:hypothetical protein
MGQEQEGGLVAQLGDGALDYQVLAPSAAPQMN